MNESYASSQSNAYDDVTKFNLSGNECSVIGPYVFQSTQQLFLSTSYDRQDPISSYTKMLFSNPKTYLL